MVGGGNKKTRRPLYVSPGVLAASRRRRHQRPISEATFRLAHFNRIQTHNKRDNLSCLCWREKPCLTPHSSRWHAHRLENARFWRQQAYARKGSAIGTCCTSATVMTSLHWRGTGNYGRCCMTCICSRSLLSLETFGSTCTRRSMNGRSTEIVHSGCRNSRSGMRSNGR